MVVLEAQSRRVEGRASRPPGGGLARGDHVELRERLGPLPCIVQRPRAAVARFVLIDPALGRLGRARELLRGEDVPPVMGVAFTRREVNEERFGARPRERGRTPQSEGQHPTPPRQRFNTSSARATPSSSRSRWVTARMVLGPIAPSATPRSRARAMNIAASSSTSKTTMLVSTVSTSHR